MNQNILKILACPDCRADLMMKGSSNIACSQCYRIFEQSHQILSLLPKREWIKKNPADAIKLEQLMKIEGDFVKENYKPGGLTEKIYSWGHATIEKLRKYNKKDIVLDLGCGIGTHLRYIKDDEQFHLCLDIDGNLLKSCLTADGAEKINLLIKGDNYFLPFKDNTLNQVISIYTLEHMDDLTRAVAEVHRTLDSRGRFYVAIPTEGLLWRLGRLFTTARTAKNKFGITNYSELAKLSHVSDAKQIIKAIRKQFSIIRSSYYPFMISSCDANLIISMECSKK